MQINTSLCFLFLCSMHSLVSMEDSLFSVQDFINKNGQPIIINNKLNLENSQINYLETLDNLENIGQITHLKLPLTIEKINYHAFNKCHSLRNLSLGFTTINQIPLELFHPLLALKKVFITDSCPDDSKKCLNLPPIDRLIPQDIRKIELRSFKNLKKNFFNRNTPVQKISIFNYRGKELTPILCENLSSLTINQAKMKIISCMAANFRSLQSFKLINCKGIHENPLNIPSKFLKEMPNIVELHINNIDISDFPTDLLQPCRNLKKLNLKQNNLLTTIPYLVASLRYLNVSDCNIDFLTPYTISNLPYLKRLYLGNNNIVDIPNNFFINSKKLKILMLNNNKINKISKETFAPLQSLIRLSLNECPLQIIDKNSFDTLTNLRELSITGHPKSEEQLPLYPKKIFKKLYLLKRLSCGSSFLKKFNMSLLKYCFSLENLTIQSDVIKHFNYNTFDQLYNIKKLSLICSKLKEIPSEVTESFNLTSLSQLKLMKFQKAIRTLFWKDPNILLGFSLDHLTIAYTLFKPETLNIRNALFHTHQALEKALKSYIQYYDNSIERTHTIKVLIKKAMEYDPEFNDLFLIDGPFKLIINEKTGFHSNAKVFSLLEKMRYPENCLEIPHLDLAKAFLNQTDRIVDFIIEKINTKFKKTEQTIIQ